MCEKAILNQAINDEDLAEATGGTTITAGSLTDDDLHNCTNNNKRDITKGKFPNCAATVEEDSWCGTNDACFGMAVNYYNMTKCSKAHK